MEEVSKNLQPFQQLSLVTVAVVAAVSFSFLFDLLFYFFYIVHISLKLSIWPRQASNLRQSFCLSLVSAGIIAVYYHTQLLFDF